MQEDPKKQTKEGTHVCNEIFFTVVFVSSFGVLR